MVRMCKQQDRLKLDSLSCRRYLYLCIAVLVKIDSASGISLPGGVVKMKNKGWPSANHFGARMSHEVVDDGALPTMVNDT